MSDSDLARTLGDNGRATIERRFNWDSVAARVLEIYRTLQAR